MCNTPSSCVVICANRFQIMVIDQINKGYGLHMLIRTEARSTIYCHWDSYFELQQEGLTKILWFPYDASK